MPIQTLNSDELKSLTKLGYDVTEYNGGKVDVIRDANGNITGLNEEYNPLENEENNEHTTLGDVKDVLKAKAGSIAGGGAGSIAGGAGGAALGAVIVPGVGALPGGIIGALLGGAGGSYGGGKLQRGLLSSEKQDELEQKAKEAEERSPIATAASELVAGAVASGGRPSVSGVTKGIPAIVRGVLGKGINNEGKQLLKNIAANEGITTGSDVLFNGQMPTPKELLETAAVSTAFPKTWIPGASHKDKGEDIPEWKAPTADVNEPASNNNIEAPVDSPFTRKIEDGKTYSISNTEINKLYNDKIKMDIPEEWDAISKAEQRSLQQRLTKLPVEQKRAYLHNDWLEEQSVKAEDANTISRQEGESPLYVEDPENLTHGDEVRLNENETGTVLGLSKDGNAYIISDPKTGKLTTVPKELYNASKEPSTVEISSGEQSTPTAQVAEGKSEGVQQTPEKARSEITGEEGQIPVAGKTYKPAVQVSSSGNIQKVTIKNPRMVNPFTGEAKIVKSQLTDRRRYEQLLGDFTKKLKSNQDVTQTWNELETLKNKYGGVPPAEVNAKEEMSIPQDIIEVAQNSPKGLPVSEFLKHITTNYNTHPLSDLFNNLLAIADKDGLNTRIHITDNIPEGVPGQYDTKSDVIRIHPDYATDGALHTEEILHALTVRKLPLLTSTGSQYLHDLQTVRNNSKDGTLNGIIDAYFKTIDHLKQRDSLFNDKEGSANNYGVDVPERLYALKNIDEFIAAAFHNLEFQKILKDIPFTKRVSTFSKLINSVRRLVGLESDKFDSLLDDVLHHSAELINRSRTEGLNKEYEQQDTSAYGQKRKGFLSKFGELFDSHINRIRNIGTKESGKLADNLKGAMNKVQELTGKWHNSIVTASDGLTNSDLKTLDKVFSYEYDNNKSGFGMLQNRQQKLFYNAARKALWENGDVRSQLGVPVYQMGKDGKFARLIKQNPFYFPGGARRDVIETFKDNTDKNKIAEYTREFDEYNQKQGMTPTDSQNVINQWVDAIREQKGDISHYGTWFSGNRRAAGIKIPTSFRNGNPLATLLNYFSRSARDIAHYEFLERDPEILNILGQKKDAWGNKVANYSSDKSLAENKLVRQAMNEWSFSRSHHDEEFERSISGITTAMMIAGPKLEIHKIVSNVARTAGTALATSPTTLVKSLTKGITSINEGYKGAVESGSLRLPAPMALRMVDGTSIGIQRLQTIAPLIRNISTIGHLTTWFNSGLLHSMFDVIIPAKINKALSGNKTELAFIRNLDPTFNNKTNVTSEYVKKLSALASSYVHGTGDSRSLPHWINANSEISGFFSLAHWSLAQTSGFFNEYIKPAKSGNYVPLISAVFPAVIGGLIIKELREKVGVTKNPIPSLEEINASSRGFEGNKGLIAYNLIAAMQYSGFGGLLSQVAKYPFDVSYKNDPQGFTFPLDEIGTDVIKTATKAAEAIANDPNLDWGLLAGDVTMHLLSHDFELSKIALHQGVDKGFITGYQKEKIELSKKLQQLRRFDMVEGLPYAAFQDGEESYIGLQSKRFRKETNPSEAIDNIIPVVQSLIDKYGNNIPVLQEKLRGLKQNSYATFPDIETKPILANHYEDYLERLQGKKAAVDTLQDYIQHKIINRAKNSAIPSL